MATDLPDDHVESIAQRVLDGKPRAGDVETLAQWARGMSRNLRASVSLRETVKRAEELRERAERDLGAAVSR
jgi:hypothetical protein